MEESGLETNRVFPCALHRSAGRGGGGQKGDSGSRGRLHGNSTGLRTYLTQAQTQFNTTWTALKLLNKPGL